MAKLYKQYKGKGLVILGVNVRWDNEADARKFVEEYGIPYRVGRDADGDIGRRYKVEGTPASFLINKDGTLFGEHQGAMTEEEFKRNIDALLKKKKKKEGSFGAARGTRRPEERVACFDTPEEVVRLFGRRAARFG